MEKTLLTSVTKATEILERTTISVKNEAEEWVERQLAGVRNDVMVLVEAALQSGYSVNEIARAYTISGRTPNRNAIYAIQLAMEHDPHEEIPNLRWVKRNSDTAQGSRVVYDLYGELDSFGPEHISGSFRWRYDQGLDELEPLIFTDGSYPYDNEFYRYVLRRWVDRNPYPGKDKS